MPLTRRTLLSSATLGVGATLFATSRAARADDPDWRSALSTYQLPGVAPVFQIRQLHSGNNSALEMWEYPGDAYLLVDAKTRTMIECSDSSKSPFADYPNRDAFYLGLGQYFVEGASGSALNSLNGQATTTSSLRAFSNDMTDAIAERVSAADTLTWSGSQLMHTAAEPGLSTPAAITPVGANDIKYRVSSYSAITGSYVYPNTVGTCGWIAGSILMRYWHVRHASHNVLPIKYRYQDNLHSSNNFAVYLQGSATNGTTALNVHPRIAAVLSQQNVPLRASWTVGDIGSLVNGYPMIEFGWFPKDVGSGNANHAVVAYGRTHDLNHIVHYGYAGRAAIKLGLGITGSSVLVK